MAKEVIMAGTRKTVARGDRGVRNLGLRDPAGLDEMNGTAGTRKTAARGAKPPRISGEKAVRKTDATVPVTRSRPSPEEKRPVPEPALDHRRQFVGTDDPGSKSTPGNRADGANRSGNRR